MIDRASPPAGRIAQVVVLAVLLGVGVNHVGFAVRDWPLGDMDVYLAAATRLRSGEPLYVAGDVAVNSYWYAPWYAVLWVPLTFLPREVVAVGWSGVLLTATGAVSARLWSYGRRGALLAIFVAPALFAVSAGGNVQALMVLALLIGLHRRWGPLGVAVAASMKFTPLLIAFAYAARGEWTKAAWSAGLTAALLLPALPMGILNAGVRSEAAPSLLGVSPVLYAVAVVSAVVVAFVVPRRHSVLAGATAAVLALPRLFVYDVTLVAVGAAREEDDAEGTRSEPPSGSGELVEAGGMDLDVRHRGAWGVDAHRPNRVVEERETHAGHLQPAPHEHDNQDENQ